MSDRMVVLAASTLFVLAASGLGSSTSTAAPSAETTRRPDHDRPAHRENRMRGAPGRDKGSTCDRTAQPSDLDVLGGLSGLPRTKSERHPDSFLVRTALSPSPRER